MQTPNAQPSESVAGLSKLFEAPAISIENLVTDSDDSGLEAEFDSLLLTISKTHACLDNPTHGVYEIKELSMRQDKSSYNCPSEYRWNQTKRRWALSREIRLIKDLRTALKSLKGKKDREFRPNLRMAGQAESSTANVHLKPTVVIRCATKRPKRPSMSNCLTWNKLCKYQQMCLCRSRQAEERARSQSSLGQGRKRTSWRNGD